MSTDDRPAQAKAKDGSPSAIGETAPLLVRGAANGSVDASERLPREPLLVSDREAAALLGISRAHFQRLRAAGKVGPEPIPLARCRRWERDALVRWVSIGQCCDAATWRAMEAQRRRLRAV